MDELLIAQAVKLAAKLHQGQVDKLGLPYIGHILRVCGSVIGSGAEDWVCAAAALHDVLEDTEATPQSLVLSGIYSRSVELVEVLTHPPGESRSDYRARIIAYGDPAIRIKTFDVLDNLGRLESIEDPKTKKRLRKKYLKDLTAFAQAARS